MRGHVRSNDRRPLPLQTMLQQLPAHAEALGYFIQNGYEWGKLRHDIILGAFPLLVKRPDNSPG